MKACQAMDSLFAIFDALELDGTRHLLPAPDESAVISGYATPDPQGLIWVVVVACLCMVYMAWGIGANDVANAMGTSVGSGAITFKQAVIIAVIFEFAGAVLAGGEVTATVRKGILDAGAFANNPELLVYGMLASLLAAATWLLIASSLRSKSVV